MVTRKRELWLGLLPLSPHGGLQPSHGAEESTLQLPWPFGEDFSGFKGRFEARFALLSPYVSI